MKTLDTSLFWDEDQFPGGGRVFVPPEGYVLPRESTVGKKLQSTFFDVVDYLKVLRDRSMYRDF